MLDQYVNDRPLRRLVVHERGHLAGVRFRRWPAGRRKRADIVDVAIPLSVRIQVHGRLRGRRGVAPSSF